MSSSPRSKGRAAAGAYHTLVSALAKRASRIGARDAEGAAQEAVKRSLAQPAPRAAIEYYFNEQRDDECPAPEWPLLQLLGWLHGVLRYVVLEERARTQREVSTTAMVEPVDSAPTPLEHVMDAEVHDIVQEALSTLSADYRSALVLRLQGTKYIDIAKQLGVNENTVATWVRRGSRALVEQIQHRLTGSTNEARFVRNIAGVSHG
jgi:DNA-directed RNA polymerase specialized sigma24 family protein